MQGTVMDPNAVISHQTPRGFANPQDHKID